MTTSVLADALAHHVWATERLIDACAALGPEQLAAPCPGTFGPIDATLRHLVATDTWYLTFFPVDQPPAMDEAAGTPLADLRTAIARNGALWAAIVASTTDSDADTVEDGDGWRFHAPVGFRLAQVVHHGTDHRSQVCTALSSLGITPPDIDLWAWGEATGRTRVERLPVTGGSEPA